MEKKNNLMARYKNIYNSNRQSNNLARIKLVRLVMFGGIFLILIFGLAYVFTHETTEDASENVFNALIPLIASWVGTVLAFYFGRDNMEAAADRFMPLSRESLDDIAVEQVMIDLNTMVYEDDEPKPNGKLNLQFLKEKYTNNRKNRIPLLSKEKLAPQYIIPLSIINNFLDENSGNPNLDKLTINDLLSDEAYKGRFGLEQTNGFVVVDPGTRLESAIIALQEIDQGKDIFITEGGKKNGKVIGWITDIQIERFLNQQL